MILVTMFFNRDIELRLRFFKISRVLSPQRRVLAKHFLGTSEFLQIFFCFRAIVATVVDNKNSLSTRIMVQNASVFICISVKFRLRFRSLHPIWCYFFPFFFRYTLEPVKCRPRLGSFNFDPYFSNSDPTHTRFFIR